MIKQTNGTPRKEIDWTAIRARLAKAGDDRVVTREEKDAVLASRARNLARSSVEAASVAVDLRLATFVLANEEYGIDSRVVMEIDRLFDFTPLPGSPPHLVGVTNLRGEILPIFDLRALLGIDRRALNDLSRIVVLGRTRAEFGILADATRDLVEITKADILPVPASVSADAARFLLGVTKDALIVLDGSKLLQDKLLFMDSDRESDDDNGPNSVRST